MKRKQIFEGRIQCACHMVFWQVRIDRFRTFYYRSTIVKSRKFEKSCISLLNLHDTILVGRAPGRGWLLGHLAWCGAHQGCLTMTICIAATCESASGLVLASDTMITNEFLSINFEHQGRKMTALSGSCIALTAGDALAYTELFNQVELQISRLKDCSVMEIVEAIKKCYQEIRRQEISEKVLVPRGFEDLMEFHKAQHHLHPEIVLTVQHEIDRYDYGLQILVAGLSGRSAHIYG